MNEKKRRIDVALGRAPADLAIVNARLVNVYTGEILDNQSVCTCNAHIACMGQDVGHAIGETTQVIDAQGATLIPGLIDGHTHLAWLFTADAFLKYAARGGTTTIITETLEVYPVAGVAGVLDFMASFKNQPIKFFGTAPPMVSVSQAANGIDTDDLETLLGQDDIIGLGESYWQSVIQNPDIYLPIFEKTLAHGKVLEGHSAGARGSKLQAYAGCEISSCHEPIKAEEVLERLRLGIYVMIREGSIRRDLAQIAAIKDMNIDTRRLILTTDGITPKDLMEMGYMEYLVQKAIDCGFDPVVAIQMATLNVAEHFGLDDRIGGIAPGKLADMVLIPDPTTIDARCVVSNGRVIAQDGQLDVSPRRHVFASASLNSIHLDKPALASDFSIAYTGTGQTASVRVIEMVTDLVTREVTMNLPVSDRQIKLDTDNDLIKVAAMDRTKFPGKTFTGLIKGFGMHAGAIASSAAWDTTCIIVVGADENDMALCVNRIRDLNGGAVVCRDGEVMAELPLPIFGLMTDLSIEQLDEKIDIIKQGAKDIGVSFPDPLLTIVTLTGAAIPYFRICEEGLVNLKDGKTKALQS
ncbi:Ade: adenine deaminase [Desulfosarcina variabilis str. Montpellier]|uniref:adenine deaminase C-terminal domain-containing protein n=1 Tax=Desulfosarcina variabilis TaxID=2300 RepID=UPI003AFA0CDE